MIKAIIFDLNGVFILSPYLSNRSEEKFGVSAKEFLPALISLAIDFEIIRGFFSMRRGIKMV